MSPSYVETGGMEGRTQIRDACMSCIIKIEAWLDGKDKRGGGQEALPD
jgi:hypothetical protein